MLNTQKTLIFDFKLTYLKYSNKSKYQSIDIKTLSF